MKKKIKVVKRKEKSSDVTDKSLLVTTQSSYEMINDWDKKTIIDALIKEADFDEKKAKEIAESVEQKIFKLDVEKVTTNFIRSLVDEELVLRGENKKFAKQALLSIPTFDLEQVFFSKSNENSNIQVNTPETVNTYIAEHVLKQYALQRVFSKDIADAHLSGAIHCYHPKTKVNVKSNDGECRNVTMKQLFELSNFYEIEDENGKYVEIIRKSMHPITHDILKITLENSFEIEITSNHEFIIKDCDQRKKIQACELIVGNIVFTKNGESKIVKIENTGECEKNVYDLETSSGTFIANDILCSNCHDLGFPIRLYCSSHSIEKIKKEGLSDLLNLSTRSKPAKHAATLTGHIITYLASIQAYYAGALGLGYLNIFYAPLLVGMTEDELKQQAQYLIFSLSQCAFSRGSQTLFIDANIHLDVPSFLRDVPAIVGSGKYCNEITLLTETGKLREFSKKEFRDKLWILTPDRRELTHDEILKYYELFPLEYNGHKIIDHIRQRKYETKLLTYSDFEDEAQKFALAMMKVWHEGDADGGPFPFPKFQLHINDSVFSDKKQNDLFMYACEMSADKGIPYFVYDRQAMQLSQCCRLKITIDDPDLLKYPERLRFVGFQNVSINLPQMAYRSGKSLEKTIDNIKKTMKLCMKAHMQKREFIEKLMVEGGPQYQIGKKGINGEVYHNLKDATYIIGVVGMNECIQHLTGFQMHESEDSYKMGLKIAASMFLYVKELAKEYDIKVVLEESPAESASPRFAKIDAKNYPESKKYIKGNLEKGDIFYTNSVHLSADANVDIIERIEKQSKFNSLFEAGAITHVFLGEQRSSKESIAQLVKQTWENTQCAQLTISPEMIVCRSCGRISYGFSKQKE